MQLITCCHNYLIKDGWALGVWIHPQAHDEGDRSIQESMLRGRQNGNVDMRPGEGEEEGGETLGTHHEPREVWKKMIR